MVMLAAANNVGCWVVRNAMVRVVTIRKLSPDLSDFHSVQEAEKNNILVQDHVIFRS